MGRQLSALGAREEAACEVTATGYELVRLDQYELAAYDAIDAVLESVEDALGEDDTRTALTLLTGARRVLAGIRHRDVTHENPRHRHIVRVARGEVAS